jgi:hypothetical protein
MAGTDTFATANPEGANAIAACSGEFSGGHKPSNQRRPEVRDHDRSRRSCQRKVPVVRVGRTAVAVAALLVGLAACGSTSAIGTATTTTIAPMTLTPTTQAPTTTPTPQIIASGQGGTPGTYSSPGSSVYVSPAFVTTGPWSITFTVTGCPQPPAVVPTLKDMYFPPMPQLTSTLSVAPDEIPTTVNVIGLPGFYFRGNDSQTQTSVSTGKLFITVGSSCNSWSFVAQTDPSGTS